MPEMTIQQAFELAVQHQQSGRLAEAESLYRQILTVEPFHADALNMLGVIALHVGRNEAAIELFGQAITLQPNSPEAHDNLGTALREIGRCDEAIVAHRRALALRPDDHETLNNLGNALVDQGQLDEAIAAYHQAIALKPDFALAHSNLGNTLKHQGRSDEAIAAYHSVTLLKPDNAEAHVNLGIALHEKGCLDEAIFVYRRAIVLKADYPEAYNNLGVGLSMKGCLDEAIAAFRQAIALNPDYPDAHNNLGNALKEAGCLDEAIGDYRRAITLNPDYSEAHNNLGNALKDKGRIEEAIACYRQAIALKADYPEAHSNLGNALTDKGQIEEAITCYRQAIALKAAYPEAYGNLGNALRETGRLEEAIAAYRHAIALKADYPEAYSNLSVGLCLKGRLDEAIAACRQAIALKPDLAEAYANLGIALKALGRLEEAIAACQSAIALKSDFAEAHSNLGVALNDMNRLDEAIATYREAIALKPDFPEAHSNLVLCMNYHPGLEATAIAEEHRRWNQMHALPLRPFIEPHANDRDPARRLRIGYVSPDFRSHSVAYFLEALLEHHDHTRVEVFCYSNVIRPDAVTVRLENIATNWRKIIGRSDSQVADLIRSDGIDIVVDLAGHTANNRLPVFARKPSPVQVTWLGYPNTTGLDTIDYRITDAFADPPGDTDEMHSEQLIRLPRSGWCYRPFENPPPVSTPPVKETGHITFGCFNAMPKINLPLLELWSRILLAVPGSRLLLKNSSLDEPSVQQQLMKQFLGLGIGPDHVEMAGRVPDHAGHLDTYGRMDIALDTFPYHGTTTTCEALWMGVPVVTLAGKTHVSRVGVSLLSNLGHPEWIAASPEEYVKIAVEMAGDITRLAELRSSLRETMQVSPLMDAAGFTRDIEAAYRKMWRKWCEQTESQPCPK